MQDYHGNQINQCWSFQYVTAVLQGWPNLRDMKDIWNDGKELFSSSEEDAFLCADGSKLERECVSYI